MADRQSNVQTKEQPVEQQKKGLAALAQRNPVLRHLKRFYWLYIFMIPGLVSISLFKLRPMYGLQVAFKDFSLVKGVWGSEWVGLEHFETLFKSANFLRVLKNSIITSILRLLWGFPLSFWNLHVYKLCYFIFSVYFLLLLFLPLRLSLT